MRSFETCHGSLCQFLLLSIVLSSSFLSQAQTIDTIFLWPQSVPGEMEAKHPPVQTDNTSGDVIRLTDVTDPALVVFEPEARNASGSCVIVCPGGAYNILAMDKEGYEIAEWLNSLGYTAVVLQYRVPDRQEGALMDIQRAIRVVRGRVEEYKLDPEKIGIMGFSAGGSLCARASTRFSYDTYEKFDDVDRFSSRPNFSMLIYPAYLDKGQDRKITPELEVTKETPPFFIFGTADDTHGNSALVMATALRDQEIPVEIHMLPEGGHGYGRRQGNIAAETWPKLAEKWLAER